MYRILVCAVFALCLCAVTVLAKEYKGAITKYDVDKKTVTVTVDGAEKTFAISDTTSWVNDKGRALNKEQLEKMKFSKKGKQATLETEEKDGKETVKDGNPVVSKITFAPKQ